MTSSPASPRRLIRTEIGPPVSITRTSSRTRPLAIGNTPGWVAPGNLLYLGSKDWDYRIFRVGPARGRLGLGNTFDP